MTLRDLVIVHAVGYPNANRSHFRATDIWTTAQPASLWNQWLAGADIATPRVVAKIQAVPANAKKIAHARNRQRAGLSSRRRRCKALITFRSPSSSPAQRAATVSRGRRRRAGPTTTMTPDLVSKLNGGLRRLAKRWILAAMPLRAKTELNLSRPHGPQRPHLRRQDQRHWRRHTK